MVAVSYGTADGALRPDRCEAEEPPPFLILSGDGGFRPADLQYRFVEEPSRPR